MHVVPNKGTVLGKIVSGDAVEVDLENISTVKDWPEPTCTREVESFLGFINYRRDIYTAASQDSKPSVSVCINWKSSIRVDRGTLKILPGIEKSVGHATKGRCVHIRHGCIRCGSGETALTGTGG